MVEVSRNVVAILLVLVIVVSGFGTWSVLSSRTSTSQSAPSQTLTGDVPAAVALQVIPRTTDASIKLIVARPNNG